MRPRVYNCDDVCTQEKLQLKNNYTAVTKKPMQNYKMFTYIDNYSAEGKFNSVQNSSGFRNVLSPLQPLLLLLSA